MKQEPSKRRENSDADPEGVRRVLLKGIFWRILIIEGILLVWSLAYRELTEPHTSMVDLLWYALRIVILIAVIIAFIWLTFRRFLTQRIIAPLEAVSHANRKFREDDPNHAEVALPPKTPLEIREIAATRKQMLDTILKVSNERLRLIGFIRETFGRYLSKKVVDRILESPEGARLGGRHETVTILMSDLRGFTSLSENTDPEIMVRLLNQYLDRMSRIILRYDGIIDEIIGDAILAVFGVPERKPDDPHRAVACALAMQNALAEMNREMERGGFPPLEMGIGINTGPVIVGNIGSEVRMKYGIVGPAVNTAARIESNTIGGQVLIGESTYGAVWDVVIAEPPRAVMMKGMNQPLVFCAVSEMKAPYNIRLENIPEDAGDVRITLPFRGWVVDGKRVGDDSFFGQTRCLKEGVIMAQMETDVDLLADVKLVFDFCVDAHCFQDIYAKVVEKDSNEKNLYTLHITAIQPGDRETLRRWIQEASG